jgi:hypothetical protein
MIKILRLDGDYFLPHLDLVWLESLILAIILGV